MQSAACKNYLKATAKVPCSAHRNKTNLALTVRYWNASNKHEQFSVIQFLKIYKKLAIMNMIPIQISDLIVGQPLPWDLFDRSQKPVQKRGYVIRTADELKEFEELPVFRLPPTAQDQDDAETGAGEKSETGKKKPDQIGFEDMQIKVGHKMYLTLLTYSKLINRNSAEISGSSYTVSMIGYVPNTSLIVTMPVTDQIIGEPFIEGDQLNIRLLTGQFAYKFTAFVDKVIKTPFKYLHLSFPKAIQGQSIRKSRRIKCQFEATVAEKSIPIAITDLSICGAGISSKLPLGTLGSMVTLSFNISILDRNIHLSIKAIIRSAKQLSKNNEKIICTGVEFADIKPDQIFALHHLIYQEIVEHPENVI